MHQLSVLIRSAPDVEGQWIAHCLNWDLVTQGNSPGHACMMMAEAIVMAIEDDLESGFDSANRPPAPPKYWELLAKTQLDGKPISPDKLGSLGLNKGAVIAATLFIRPTSARPRSTELDRSDAFVPPPFMIAALEGDSRSAHH